MEEIYQTNTKLPQPQFHQACYLMSILYMLEDTFHIGIWSIDGINKIYQEEIHNNIIDIDPDTTVENPQNFIDNVLGKNKIKFMGKDFGPDYQTKEDEIEILCWHKKGNNFNHFCYGNGRGVNIYDPWPGGADSVKNGDLISKRIFKIL